MGSVTAAPLSRAERRRAAKSQEFKAPLVAQIRPVTIAELAPGEACRPGDMVFCIETLPAFGKSGASSRGYQCRLWLPPEYREQNELNARLAMELLRHTNPLAAREIDKIVELAQDPRSLREAKRRGFRTGFLPPDEAARLLGRMPGPPGPAAS